MWKRKFKKQNKIWTIKNYEEERGDIGASTCKFMTSISQIEM